jgi:iron-sulfur cluster assembly protein
MRPDIVVTQAASAYIKAVLLKNRGKEFRLSIKKTGCSGYAYLPAMVTTVNTKDIKFDIGDGVKIFLDAAWAYLLSGLIIDYSEENKFGLKQKRLVFINPNEFGRCGCGDSFHIK